jgi:hypothetical protein
MRFEEGLGLVQRSFEPEMTTRFLRSGFLARRQRARIEVPQP